MRAAVASACVLGVVLLAAGVGLVARWWRRRRRIGVMPEGGAEAMLVTGACIGLGWDGRGPMPRKLRREAVRRLEVALARLEAGGRA